MTRERAAELLSDVTVLDDPEMAEAHRVAISALRQQEHDRNEPLTLDELRTMDGELIYIVYGDVAWWDIVSFSVQDWLYLAREEELRYSRYGEWLAYRQMPEEGTV